LAFSPDGKTLASSSWNAIRLWEAATGKERFGPPVLHGSVVIAALSPDGRALATAGDSTISLWEALSGKLLRQLPRERTDTLALHFGKRGRLTLWERSRGLRTMDGATGKLRLRWEPTQGLHAVLAAVFDAEGRKLLVLAPGDRMWSSTLSLWDAREGKRLRKIFDDSNDLPGAHLIALSGDGRLAAEASWLSGTSVRVWETATGWKHGPFRLDNTRPGAISVLALSGDGGLLAAGTSAGPIHLWETSRGREIARLIGHTGTISALLFSPDGKMLASGDQDGVVRVWEAAAGKERDCFLGHRGPVHSLCFARGSKLLASGSGDTTALLWDLWREAGGHAESGMFDQRWQDLAGGDARRAFHAAQGWLRSGTGGVRHLQARLTPVPSADGKRLARLLAALDSDDFTAREAAARGLEEMGERIEPDLRRVLAGRPSAEVRRRLEGILPRLYKPGFSREELRAWRALEVLEQMETREAERLLEVLARGAPGARMTREAGAALRRLKDAR
jgi:hypothetical protein